MDITKEQKYKFLERAMKITCEAASGGCLTTPAAITQTLEQVYKTIVKIVEEIEQ